MNILSICPLNALQSHLTPLYVLNQRYFSRMTGVKNMMLTQNKFNKEFTNKGINVLPIDFSQFSEINLNVNRTEKKSYKVILDKLSLAFNMVKPEIVFDSFEPFSAYIAEHSVVPRISIQSTGIFRSIDQNKRNPRHIHSMEKIGDGRMLNADIVLHPKSKLSNLLFEHLNYCDPDNNYNFLKTYTSPKTKIVPGIPTIERLPVEIENKESYFYTGPLLVEDFYDVKLFEEIDQFFAYNMVRKIIFISTEQVENFSVTQMVNYLLNRGYAVVSNTDCKFPTEFKNHFFTRSFLPLNKVCSMCDLIIHNCDFGIYHYPLLQKKPSLTLGTQCYDREDIALRLQELYVSKHVPSPRDNDNYLEIFFEYIELFEKGDISDYTQLNMLEEMIYDTMLNFDMEEVLKFTLN